MGDIQEDRSPSETLTAGWKEQPKSLAQKLVKQYGEPNEATSERLIWQPDADTDTEAAAITIRVET